MCVYIYIHTQPGRNCCVVIYLSLWLIKMSLGEVFWILSDAWSCFSSRETKQAQKDSIPTLSYPG